MDIGLLGGLYNLVHRHQPEIVAVGDVLRDGPVEEDRFLADDAQLRSQIAQRDRRDVAPVHRHGAGNRVVESLQQLDAGRFAASALANQGDHLARLHDQIQSLQNLHLGPRRVVELDLGELYQPVRLLQFIYRHVYRPCVVPRAVASPNPSS